PDLVSSLDLFPTLLDFAGAPIPPGRVGLDLRHALESGAAVPRTELIGAMQKARPVAVDGQPQPWAKWGYYIRTPRWHYLQYPEEKREQLFDMQADPREHHDLAATHPKQIEAFRKQIGAWKVAMPSPASPAP